MGTLASELGPHIEGLTSRPRIYADANVPAGVVSHMRRRLGWDVLSVVEDDELRRASDIEHYRMARKLQRTLVSLDADFLDERRFPPDDSGGVIILSAPDERGVIRSLGKINQVFFVTRGPSARRPVAPLVGQKIHVHPDWSHPELTARSRRRRRRRETQTKRALADNRDT